MRRLGTAVCDESRQGQGQDFVAHFFYCKVAPVTIGCQGSMMGQPQKSGCLPDGECHGPGSTAMKQGCNINNLLSSHMSVY